MKHFLEVLHKIVHEAHEHRLKATAAATHVTYCGAVFIEGHGMYPCVAGIMGVLILIEFVRGE